MVLHNILIIILGQNLGENDNYSGHSLQLSALVGTIRNNEHRFAIYVEGIVLASNLRKNSILASFPTLPDTQSLECFPAGVTVFHVEEAPSLQDPNVVISPYNVS
jgi:hypothetical protein